MKHPETDKRFMDFFNTMPENLSDTVTRNAKIRPNEIALIDYPTDKKFTYKEFDSRINAYASNLLAMGLKKGDVVATSLPFLYHHVFLLLACCRIGVVIAPLDPRLKAEEIIYCFEKMRPRVYIFPRKNP